MVGRELGAIYAARSAAAASKTAPILSVRNLKAPPLVRDVSFDLHRGEILGLGGLVGAGRSETLESIFGLRQRAGGVFTLEGKPFAPRSPAEAIRAGIGFVAEDRRRQSIVPDLSVKENLLLGHLGAHRGFGLGYNRLDRKMRALLARLDLPAHRLADENMLNFSGGMQQKIIIARWLLLEPKVLLLDEPTKGVDIGTRSSIYAILRDIAARGAAIIIVSSEFAELIGLADRIVVMSDGASIADVPSGLLDEEKLTLLAAPRSSMERNQQLLSELAAEHDGAAFWAILDEDRVFCLNFGRGQSRRRSQLQGRRDAAFRRDAASAQRWRRGRPDSCAIRPAASRAWSLTSRAIAATISARSDWCSIQRASRRRRRRFAPRSWSSSVPAYDREDRGE